MRTSTRWRMGTHVCDGDLQADHNDNRKMSAVRGTDHMTGAYDRARRRTGAPDVRSRRARHRRADGGVLPPRLLFGRLALRRMDREPPPALCEKRPLIVRSESEPGHGRDVGFDLG